MFSKTAGFRHSSIPNGIAAIQQLGAANGFTVTATEDAGQFTTANLAQYQVVVWLSTTGDVLNTTQQNAFQSYIASGGGYVGVHAAADTEYDWPWYGGLVGAYFHSHPANQQATVRVEDRNASTNHLPAELGAHRRVVQLPRQPAAQRARAAEPRRGLLQRRHHGRPPDHLVPELRRRARLVHRARATPSSRTRTATSPACCSAASRSPAAP